MDPEVACVSCHASFSILTHPGLVRCPECVERTAFRLPSSRPGRVEVEG